MTEKIKILIVDDIIANIHSLAGLIEAEDIEIFSTTDTNEALSMLTQNDFGLALIDVEMPIMNGFELARTIRSVNRHRHLPIVFVTAHQGSQSILFEGYDTGAVDMLFKPLEPMVVRHKVRAFVEFQKQKDLLKAQVAELERLRLASESASLAKSQFLANMSHEIRTPLAAVLGFTDILLDKECTPDEKQKYSATVKKNGVLLLNLIDDVLDLSKIEANQLGLESIEFNLLELFHEVETTLSIKSQKKNLKLSFKLPDKLTYRLIGDPNRIKQVLLNLIGNAIKFTENGEVEVTLQEQKNADDNKASFRVTIRDEGVGIAAKAAQKLFENFSQADPSTNRKFGGSGLGLAISRRLATAFDGNVRLLSSEPGKGSTFEFTFKLREAPHESKVLTNNSTMNEKTKNVNFHARKILIVDDSQDNLTLLDAYLKNTNADLKLMAHPLEVAAAAKAWDPDLILLDIQMPEMDGYEVIGQLRKDGFLKPVIAVTAHAMSDEKEKCFRKGFTDIIFKPIDRKILLQSLQKNLPNEI